MNNEKVSYRVEQYIDCGDEAFWHERSIEHGPRGVHRAVKHYELLAQKHSGDAFRVVCVREDVIHQIDGKERERKEESA